MVNPLKMFALMDNILEKKIKKGQILILANSVNTVSENSVLWKMIMSLNASSLQDI